MKNKISFFALVFVTGLTAASFTGCKKSSDKVVAQAGSVKITQSDFVKELASSPPLYQNYLSTMEGKKQFLDILLKEKMLLSAAEKSGIDKKQEFKKNLKDYEDRVKEQLVEFRKGLLMREYIRQLKDTDMKVTDADVRTYFDSNKSEYSNPIKVTASHILCLTQADAEHALQRIKKGEDFAAVAREVSKDPTAARGGLIGDVLRGDLSDLPEFENELFRLKPKQVSGIVQTKIGYHIIMKVSETRLPSQTFEEATPHIRKLLEKKKFDAWMENAKKEQKLTIDEKALASIAVPQPEAQSAPVEESAAQAPKAQ